MRNWAVIDSDNGLQKQWWTIQYSDNILKIPHKICSSELNYWKLLLDMFWNIQELWLHGPIFAQCIYDFTCAGKWEALQPLSDLFGRYLCECERMLVNWIRFSVILLTFTGLTTHKTVVVFSRIWSCLSESCKSRHIPGGPRWAPCWPHEPCYQGY